MTTPQRPKFDPSPCDASMKVSENGWTPLITCAADFPIEVFEIAISQLIHHPEYNSTLILRSDVISDTTAAPFPDEIAPFDGVRPVRCIRRKLLPRRPGRDPALEQWCTLYTGSGGVVDTLVLTPIVEPGVGLPYYHPTVEHLAFRYLKDDTPTLRIDAVPLPGTPTDLNSRLYRTCLALLETLHRYGWGAVTHYKKRVNHDCLVPREEYQDLYLVMRERHRHLVDTWKEVTDPLKHVFEDIGIATYLMLLWKHTFSTGNEHNDSSSEPWKSWPRPPGGFLDIGCGNGLLTHILIAEGYSGYGIDLRARTSWTHYPAPTQAALQVHAVDPTLDPAAQTYLPPGVFVIGNHADELTPWVPVLATLHRASGYLSIPCCAWAFDARFERSATRPFAVPEEEEEGFEGRLNLGGEGSGKSAYSMYRVWLAGLSVHCGWEVECETLRIPSTRNWAIIGRRRLESMDEAEAQGNVQQIVEDVKMRALFKTRRPEGKAGDH